jgi:hypothetical protein
MIFLVIYVFSCLSLHMLLKVHQFRMSLDRHGVLSIFRFLSFIPGVNTLLVLAFLFLD